MVNYCHASLQIKLAALERPCPLFGGERPLTVRHLVFLLTQDRGGPVDLTVALARELADRDDGPHVTVVAPTPVSSAGNISDLIIPLHIRSMRDLDTARRVADVLKDLNADVVHAQDRRAGLLCAAARPTAAVVGTYHGLPEDVEYSWVAGSTSSRQIPSLRSRAVLIADAIVARRLSFTVTPSAYMAAFLRERLRVPSNRVGQLPNGVVMPHARRLPATLSTFVYVGQLGPVKAVGTLLEALALLRRELPRVHLNIVGDGPLREALEARAQQPDLLGSVTFLGYRTDVSVQLAKAQGFVLPSVNENQPLALLEAMGAGLACVATEVGGIPELLGDAGLLVPPGDSKALASALRLLATKSELGSELGSRAASRARATYSIEHCADRHLQLYNEMVASKRPPSDR